MNEQTRRPQKGDTCRTPTVCRAGCHERWLHGVVVNARRKRTILVQWFLPDGREGGLVEERRASFLPKKDGWVVALD